MGLELKPSKTRITHTLHRYEGQQPGVDFLGFTIRQVQVGKYQSGKNPHGRILGFKTLIKPSKEKLKEHSESISKSIKALKTASQWRLIDRINPVIKGWAKYYSTVVSKKILEKMDNLTYQKLFAWAKRRHPNKSKKWIVNRYWGINQGEGWAFVNRKRGKYKKLTKHSETKIIRHTKVKGERSPYDGDKVYWSTKMGRHPEVPKRVATLLKKQKGKCTHCELTFKDGDLMEVHHKIPRSVGGKDSYDNFRLLHRHCHDKVTAQAVGTKRARRKTSVPPKPKKVKRSA